MVSQLISTPLSWDASTWAAIVAAIAAIIPIGIDLWRSWNVKQEKQKLEAEFGMGVYLPEEIERSIKYYVEPDCSTDDPAREDEIRNLVARGQFTSTQKLFEVIDNFLAKDSVDRHMIILADSGMGKTSALISYYARNRKRRKYKIALIPLGREDANEPIKRLIDDHKGDVTDIILFLDAFDEDTLAIADRKERLAELMKVCKDFKRIILTCRTQFYLNDKEIPVETGIIRVTSRKAGESDSYEFKKRLYLMPFSDKIVAKYLRRLYRWNWLQRRRARKFVYKVPQLNVRPMLLANMPDLLDSPKKLEFSYELYEALINAWLKREDWRHPEKLRHFSERLAVDLFVNYKTRGQDRIPTSELLSLAKKWKIDLESWRITGRSLLNRDAEGNYKFAHRSIMEYLFLTCDTTGLDIDWNKVELTDQMHSFIRECAANLGINLFKNMPKAILSGANLHNADLSRSNLYGADLSSANLSGADLCNARLHSADLKGANLRDARYDGKTKWPQGFDYRHSGAIGPEANLSGVNLSGTNLINTDLKGANLRGARYDSKTQWPQGFDYRHSGAIGPVADLRDADLRDADLRSADLSSAYLSNAYLSGADLSGANLSGANLINADLSSARLNGARLSGADLRTANLSGANLDKADLSGTDLSRANLSGADLRTANLTGANLVGANLSGVRHNSQTRWHQDFDPKAAGAIVV